MWWRIFLIIGLFLLPLILTTSTFAQAPIPFYDWSTTLETRDLITSAPILGTTTYRYPQQYQRYKGYIIAGDLTPDSRFYFLKTFQENVKLALTFDKAKKKELQIKLAGERLNEIQELTKKGKYEKLASASQRYSKLLKNLNDSLKKEKSKNADIAPLLKTYDQEVAKHIIILEEVQVKIPQTSKNSIQTAVEASYEGTDTVADLEQKPSVPSDVVDRIQALKAQGILTSEEAAKIINSKSRAEARDELKKYVNEGIFPEADFLKLNESAKELYAQDFYKIHEIKRFYELKKLEQEKPDKETLAKIQSYAKEYKAGDIVPPDIKKYWVLIIRKEELDNTFRPDLVDTELLKSNPEDAKKFTEIVERYKPTTKDVAFLKDYLEKNPDAGLPPEYERVKALSEKLGTASATPSATLSKTLSCPSNTHFAPYSNVPEGGICIPNFTEKDEKAESASKKEFPCPSGYFRPTPDSYCTPVYKSGEPPLKPATSTPGDYPNPIYPPASTTLSNPPVGGGSSPTPPQAAPTPTVTSLIYPPGYPPSPPPLPTYYPPPPPSPSPTPPPQPTPTTSPPSGYGTCPSGQIWNGYICMIYPPPSPTQPPPPPPPSPTVIPTSVTPTQAPSGNPQTHSNPEGLYTITFPGGWTIERAPGAANNHSYFYFWNQAKPTISGGSCAENELLKNGLFRGQLEIYPLYYHRAGGATTVTEEDFYKAGSDTWYKSGEYIEYTTQEVSVGGQRAMLQTTRYIKRMGEYYCTPDINHIKKEYFVFIGSRLGKKTYDGKPLNEAILISITYDVRNPSKDTTLAAFEQMLSTMKLSLPPLPTATPFVNKAPYLSAPSHLTPEYSGQFPVPYKDWGRYGDQYIMNFTARDDTEGELTFNMTAEGANNKLRIFPGQWNNEAACKNLALPSPTPYPNEFSKNSRHICGNLPTKEQAGSEKEIKVTYEIADSRGAKTSNYYIIELK